jgi:hypothetical protein
MRLVTDIIHFLVGETPPKPTAYPHPEVQYWELSMHQQRPSQPEAIKGTSKVVKPMLKLPPGNKNNKWMSPNFALRTIVLKNMMKSI